MELSTEILKVLDGQIFAVWFLIGAAFVFWMQAGFAMCEAGFTRAKNAGNIIMKNLMDFCIGTVMWFICGASLMLGENVLHGFMGGFSFDVFTHYSTFDYSSFVFNLVFCATTATIVSGSMAERTKFSSYCIYSAIISALIYPIEAHWTWGGGFLDLPDRSTLDLGRRLPCAVGISRLRGIQLHSYGRRHMRICRRMDAWTSNR